MFKKQYSYQNSLIRFLAYIVDFLGNLFFFWIKKNNEIKISDIKKILIVKLDHIGDGFIMLPFIESLKNIFNEAKIDILTPNWVQEIYQYNPYINNIIIYDYFRTNRQKKSCPFIRTTIKLLKKLRERQYDLFIDARGDPLISLIGFLIGAKSRIGFIGDEIGSFFYTHLIKYNKKEYDGDKYLDILKIFNKKIKLSKPKLYPNENERNKVENIINTQFQNKKIIVLHITSGLPYKIWPFENFIKLIQEINQKYPQRFEFVVLGGISDKDYPNLTENSQIKIQDFSGFFNLRESYFFISKASLFIGNDSALVHFAASFNIPTIDIFNGANDKNRWVPKNKNVYIVEGKNPNHYCKTKDCPYPCPNMRDIQVKRVFEACECVFKKNEKII